MKGRKMRPSPQLEILVLSFLNPESWKNLGVADGSASKIYAMQNVASVSLTEASITGDIFPEKTLKLSHNHKTAREKTQK